jgi:uncharacterized protein (TIGR03435 family)
MGAISVKLIRIILRIRCKIQTIVGSNAVATLTYLSVVTCGMFAHAEHLYPQQAQDFTFEVASIKHERDTAGIYNWKLRFESDSFQARGQTVKMLLKYAYGLDDNEILGGPSWMGRQTFAIDAKIDPDTASVIDKLSEQQQVAAHRQMVQHLLATRFNLEVHTEMRIEPVYSLKIVPGGEKLRHQNQDPARFSKSNEYGLPAGTPRLQVYAGEIRGDVAMPTFVKIVSNEIGRKVIDETGLSGTYNIDLQFAPDSGVDGVAALIPGSPTMPSPASPKPESESLPNGPQPTLFTALKEQLGLTLAPVKAAVDILVVDRLNEPSAN